MNTLEFETCIKSTLQTIANVDFYQNKAPTSAQLPYCVFRFESVIDTEPTYLVNLVFSCFDSQECDTKQIKETADKIQNVFNKKVLKYDNLSVHSILTIRQEIPSEMLTEKQGLEMQFDLILYS